MPFFNSKGRPGLLMYPSMFTLSFILVQWDPSTIDGPRTEAQRESVMPSPGTVWRLRVTSCLQPRALPENLPENDAASGPSARLVMLIVSFERNEKPFWRRRLEPHSRGPCWWARSGSRREVGF